MKTIKNTQVSRFLFDYKITSVSFDDTDEINIYGSANIVEQNAIKNIDFILCGVFKDLCDILRYENKKDCVMVEDRIADILFDESPQTPHELLIQDVLENELFIENVGLVVQEMAVSQQRSLQNLFGNKRRLFLIKDLVRDIGYPTHYYTNNTGETLSLFMDNVTDVFAHYLRYYQLMHIGYSYDDSLQLLGLNNVFLIRLLQIYDKNVAA